jgi:hypothetical protein
MMKTWSVWNHGQRIGVGFKSSYSKRTKKGGGAAQLNERHQNATACLGVGPKIRKFMRISLNKEQKKNVARNHSKIKAKAKLRNMAQLYDNKATTKLGKAWAKWFHRNGIPGTKADCPYFRRTMELTQQLGASALVPTDAEIDDASLDASEEED